VQGQLEMILKYIFGTTIIIISSKIFKIILLTLHPKGYGTLRNLRDLMEHR